MKVIYQLRMQCKTCKLDKMVNFYRVKNGIPNQMYKGHEEQTKMDWPEKHGCKHKIKFTRTTIQDYRWDEKNNRAVKVEV